MGSRVLYHVKFDRLDSEVAVAVWEDGTPEPALVRLPDAFASCGAWGVLTCADHFRQQHRELALPVHVTVDVKEAS